MRTFLAAILIAGLFITPAASAEALNLYRFDWADQSDPYSVSMRNSLAHPAVVSADAENHGFARDGSSHSSRRNTFSYANSTGSYNNHVSVRLTPEPGKLVGLNALSFRYQQTSGGMLAQPFRVDVADGDGALLSSQMVNSQGSGVTYTVPLTSVPLADEYEVRLHANTSEARFDDLRVTGRLAPETIDVFILAGQSNMSGRATTGFAPDPRDSQVRYYYRTDGPSANDQTSLGEVLRLDTLPTGYYGPEIGFGRSMVDKGYNPAIIKISDGGTALSSSWNSRKDPNITGLAEDGRMWRQWKDGVAEALAGLVADGHAIRLRGFLWFQGESDTAPEERANSYQENFENMLEDVETFLEGLGHDTSEMLYVTALIKGPENDKVRLAQKAVMDALGDRGHWFDTNDIDRSEDYFLVHISSAGMPVLADRFAAPFPAAAVPEPGSVGVVLVGALWAAASRRRPRG